MLGDGFGSLQIVVAGGSQEAEKPTSAGGSPMRGIGSMAT
jgi:hypothetical protein